VRGACLLSCPIFIGFWVATHAKCQSGWFKSWSESPVLGQIGGSKAIFIGFI